ncbi:MAG: DNA replication and repair protein RecF [Sandaracinaceae bacterium]|nr:DNA replication and repair protein RecF [Sandaracinaceae bacterium]
MDWQALAEAASPCHLLRLVVNGFRNLKEIDLAPGPKINVISGNNGQGKSNLLESLRYASTLRSFRASPRDALIGWGSPWAQILCWTKSSGVSNSLEIRIERKGQKSLRLNGKHPSSFFAWLNALPTVIFHPAEIELIQGGPERRREWLDTLLSAIEPQYAHALKAYGRALQHRNDLLRQEPLNRQAIVAFDALLANHGAQIAAARFKVICELERIAKSAWTELFDKEADLSISLHSRVEPSESSLLRALAERLPQDQMRGFTSVGPHTDDLLLFLGSRSAKYVASQGQKRALALALKLAELWVFASRNQRLPLLLLDDITSELDPERNQKLLHLLSRIGAQVFLTTTHPELIRIEKERSDWWICDGRLKPL